MRREVTGNEVRSIKISTFGSLPDYFINLATFNLSNVIPESFPYSILKVSSGNDSIDSSDARPILLHLAKGFP